MPIVFAMCVVLAPKNSNYVTNDLNNYMMRLKSTSGPLISLIYNLFQCIDSLKK